MAQRLVNTEKQRHAQIREATHELMCVTSRQALTQRNRDMHSEEKQLTNSCV